MSQSVRFGLDRPIWPNGERLKPKQPVQFEAFITSQLQTARGPSGAPPATGWRGTQSSFQTVFLLVFFAVPWRPATTVFGINRSLDHHSRTWNNHWQTRMAVKIPRAPRPHVDNLYTVHSVSSSFKRSHFAQMVASLADWPLSLCCGNLIGMRHLSHLRLEFLFSSSFKDYHYSRLKRAPAPTRPSQSRMQLRNGQTEFQA